MADVNLRWNGIDLDQIFLKNDEGHLISAYLTSGNIYTWGDNQNGIFGNNETTDRSSPVQIGTQNDWISIATGTSNSIIALKENGTIWSWGGNEYGQLGQNDIINKSSPVQLGTDTNWKNVAMGVAQTFAIKTDGTLWGWGENIQGGGLGLNDRIDRSSPVQVGTQTNWKYISAGEFYALAIKNDGTLWGWGYNFSGNLGLNDRIYRSSPVQLGTDTNWKTVNASGQTSLAVKTNGTLWSWGSSSNYGLLGQNLSSSTFRSSPVQIGTQTDWNRVFGSQGNRIYVIKNDGSLWTWGQNLFGQLGLNDRISRSSPIQVGTNTNWKKIYCGITSTVALKTDGSLWSWGFNSSGELGLNDTIDRSSPVQVGTNTNWRDLPISGQSHSAAVSH